MIRRNKLPNLKKLSLINTEVDNLIVGAIEERNNKLNELEWIDIRGCKNINSIPEEMIYFPRKI